ncbi:MAG: hypothetical protein U0R52_11280 [Solirubrobacterales bacterium]
MPTDATLSPPRRSPRSGGLFDMVLEMRLTHVRCGRCGSILDAPRVDPQTGRLGRKCCDCDLWSPLEAAAH